MPSLVHDALVTLFRNRPTLAPELLGSVLHAPLPAFQHVRVGDAALTEVVPTEYRADLVLLLEGSPSGSPRAAIVVEAQLGRDADKRWSWPVYLTGLRARLRCDVALLVVTADPAMATWAATPIATGHPAHATLAAVRGLDDERAKLYADLVLLSVDEAARAILEALMASGTYVYQSDFARRYIAQGEAEGEAKGRAEGEASGRAHSVLAVLAARQVKVPEAAREQITACADLELLDRWLALAVTAQSVADVLGE